MKIIVMGCGRVGSRLANVLDSEGHEVVVVDRNQQSFRRLKEDFGGRTVLGTGIDEDVLVRAGVEGADVFVATTEGDNRNLMSAQIAQKVFNVPMVIARTYDPGRSEIYEKLGLKTYCPTLVGARLLHEMILGKE
ncbi:MAG TPA: TrkA family potassium uptake protein [Chloroflexota bacterium]|nr:TrkA family potassium uptake protein [Chloroflexota bacterium]